MRVDGWELMKASKFPKVLMLENRQDRFNFAIYLGAFMNCLGEGDATRFGDCR